MLQVCLIRHGETDWNAARRLQGWQDEPLNAIGRAQAQALLPALAQQSFDALYCSDLLRARQTAAPLAQALGLDIQLSEQLRERHFGDYQGMTWDEILALVPEQEARDNPPNGETRQVVLARVAAFLGHLPKQHAGQSILVVTHGGVLDLIYRWVNGIALAAPRTWALPNAALNWLQEDAGRWDVLRWGDQTHWQAARDELRGSV